MTHHFLGCIGIVGFLGIVSPLALAADATRSSSCGEHAGRAIAICVTDTMKQWQREHYDYHAKQNEEHTAWHVENDPKGISQENSKAHRDFHERQNRRHTVFHDTQRQKERQLNVESDMKRLKAPKSESTKRKPPEAARLAEGLQKCAGVTGEEYHRICMKPYLRPAGR